MKDALNGERVLIIRLGALGDVANVMPAVAGLRRARPENYMAWLVEESASGLVAINRDVDECVVFPRVRFAHALRRPWLWPSIPFALWRFVRGLRRSGFDRVLDFQGHLKSGLLARATKCPWRAGFASAHSREGNPLFQTVRVELPEAPCPRRDKALRLVQALAPDAQNYPPNLRVGAANMEAVHGFLNSLPPAKARVAIHPGASHFGDFKRWPPERFGEVARRLGDEFGARSIVTHGPAESARTVAEVLRASGEAAVPAPALPLAQLVGLLRECDLFVGADSGPLHVASLVGSPCVAIFGPKDPAVYAPPGTRVVRRSDLECSPCTRRSCPSPRCLLDIAVDDVFEAVAETLGNGPSR